MADAVTVRYIYPPNHQDLPSVLGDGEPLGRDGHQGGGARRYILHLHNVSDGTGESLVNKFDLSEHHFTNKPLLRTVIEWVEYDILGMDVTLYWDRDSVDPLMVRLPGGATTTSGKIRGPLTDPGTGDGTDGTGDILLTTTNHSSGDSYDIRMCIRSKVKVRPVFD